MGVRALPRIAEQLVAGGRAADEPVAIVERGTLPDQRVVRGTLADDRRARGGGGMGAGGHARRPGGRPADELAWLRGAPAARAARSP